MSPVDPLDPAVADGAPGPVPRAARKSTRPGPLGGELRIAIVRVARRLRAQRGVAELPEGQFGVLVRLHRHGPMSPGALADLERIKPPSMTRTVNALAELGLVRKVEHPTDGRQVVVDLTEEGEAEVQETRRRRDAWLARQLAVLTEDERRTLAAASEILTRIAEA